MKINRVILVSNNNPLYMDFWNNLSFTYKEKFGINPTLIFFGSKDDVVKNGLSEKYGNIIIQNKIDGLPEWQYTWALFYYTKFYKEDTCVIMGIDQIPLGTYFLKDLISEINDEKYVMLIDNHYTYHKMTPHKWDSGGYSPSGYHIAKGKTFDEIYNFEDTFEGEILKVKNSGVKPMWDNGWGTDEAYSCKVLYEYFNRERIVDLGKSEYLISRRIDCHRNIEVPYNIDLLNKNYYIECHACRPYSNHKEYLDKLFNNIPKFVNE